MKFYKVTNQEENHRGMQYLNGLNIDIKPFDPLVNCWYGISFAREDIFAFFQCGPWIREVTIPKDGKVCENPGNPKQWKADKVILGVRKPWNDFSIFKELIDAGANIHAGDDLAICMFSYYNNLEVVKYLIESGADIHARNDLAFRWASENGHFEIVKYLVENGAWVHAVNDYAIHHACKNKHFKIVNYLIGEKIHWYLYNSFGANYNKDSITYDNARQEVLELLQLVYNEEEQTFTQTEKVSYEN